MKRALLSILGLLMSSTVYSAEPCKCVSTCYLTNTKTKVTTVGGAGIMYYGPSAAGAAGGDTSCSNEANIKHKYSGDLFCSTPKEKAKETCEAGCSGSWWNNISASCGEPVCGAN